MLRLALKSLLNRRGTVLLTVFTIAISTALLVGVERLRGETRSSFASTLSGTDLIVGARAGTVQLLLYTVFRLGEPTANVSWETYQRIAGSPMVAWTVPLSLGDSYRGYRVLGTTEAYFQHYRYGSRRPLEFSAGAPFQGVYEAVLGAEVARALGHGVGDDLVVAHGIGRVSFAEHDDKPFRVVGVLAATGTPVDRTVHVPLAGIEAIHLDWQSGTRMPGRSVSAEDALQQDLTPASITAFLVGMENRVQTFALQRQVNEYRAEALSAVLPGVALQQLWSLTGVAENALRIVAACVVVVGLLGMLTALLTTLNERRREMAILRSVGARPRTILGLMVLEAAALAGAGLLLGLGLLYAILAALRELAATRFGLFLGMGPPSTPELLALAGILAGALVVGLVPALLAYRRSLSDGLTVRI